MKVRTRKFNQAASLFLAGGLAIFSLSAFGQTTGNPAAPPGAANLPAAAAY